jgi:hyaluronan synthase
VLAFVLQLNAWIDTGQVFLFAVFMLLIWLLWLLRVTLGSYYRPWQGSHTTTTSVIIPVVDEPEDLFRSVLERIVEQRPTETIVVINGPRNPALEKICADLGVRWVWTEVPGKRNALRIGVGLATGEIAVLVDSDTIWTADTLRELVKPFRDPTIGGVATRQRILDPGRSVLTRWADWLENVRNLYSMPAMTVVGAVGCLPGRTIAFRRQILVDCMDRFMRERFLGIHLEVSDDRALTNYTLMAGYRTVFQSTSLVYTDAPTRLGRLIRQQYRWARGSQYNTLRMLPWMLRHAPVLAFFYVSDIVVPFVLVGALISWAVVVYTGTRAWLYEAIPLLPDASWLAVAAILILAAVMTLASLGIRFGRHFGFRPGDLLYLPLFMMINGFVLIPVRVAGFLGMAHNAGWGTRSGGFAGERQMHPQRIMPCLLGGAMLAASVWIGV